MRVKRQISANSRRKHLRLQHHKINTRRQYYFNQLVNQTLGQETTAQS